MVLYGERVRLAVYLKALGRRMVGGIRVGPAGCPGHSPPAWRVTLPTRDA